MADEEQQQEQQPSDEGKGEFKPPQSQEEFNRIISDRLQRDRDARDKKYADYAQLKAKADAHDKALEDAQTEQEKAVAAARKEGEQAASERANSRLIGAEARAVAASAGFRNPSAAVKLADLSAVAIGEDGEVDGKALKTALDALAESDPYLLNTDDGKPQRPKPDASQGGGGGKRQTTVSAGRDLFAERHGKKTSA